MDADFALLEFGWHNQSREKLVRHDNQSVALVGARSAPEDAVALLCSGVDHPRHVTLGYSHEVAAVVDGQQNNHQLGIGGRRAVPVSPLLRQA